MGQVSDRLGASPPRKARPLSLAVRDFLLERRAQFDSYGIVIGVSGGADSLALALAAVDVAERADIPYCPLVVDHAMREESAAEAQAVAEYLRELGASNVKVLTVESRGDGQETPSLESTARTVRHKLLEGEAKSWGKDLQQVDILLGHTMDDQAETVLLRLARGSGAASLSAMEPVLALDELGESPSIARVRPLLSLRRSDTEAFCSALSLNVVDDPTNRMDGPWQTKSGEPLPRAAVRGSVLPALAAALGQDPVPALARTAELVRLDNSALEEWAERIISGHLTTEGDEISVPLEVLTGLPSAVRTRVLLQAATLARVPALNLHQVRALEQLVESAKNAAGDGRVAELPGGFVATRVGGSLQIKRSAGLAVSGKR